MYRSSILFCRLGLFAILLGMITASSSAQRPSFIFDFLRTDGSARSAAMAGAFVTVGEDPVGILYNPALLSSIDSTSPLSVTGFKHVLDINSGSVAGATSFEGIGTLGAAVTFNSYGSFDRTDRNGNVVGEFGSSDLLLTVGWGNDLGEGFSAGLSGEFFYSGIDDVSSVGIAIGGGLYFVDTTLDVQAGLSLLHLGTQLSTFDETSESLPIDLKLGVSHQLRGLPLLLALNFSELLDETDDLLDKFSSFSIGGEFTIADPVRVRLGYDNRVRQDISFGGSKGLGGLAAGLGIIIDEYRFDYGFSSLAGIGGLHRVSLNADL